MLEHGGKGSRVSAPPDGILEVANEKAGNLDKWLGVEMQLETDQL